MDGQGQSGVKLDELSFQLNLAACSIILARNVERGDLGDGRVRSAGRGGEGAVREPAGEYDTYDG